jgi:signal transduction histidine kinase
MAASLPIQENSRQWVAQVSQSLFPQFPAITASWRKKMFEEFELDGRAMTALERLNLGTGFAICSQSDLEIFAENLSYYGTRLAKLNIDTRIIARSLELYQELCEPWLEEHLGEQHFEALAATQAFSAATFVAVSAAYFDTRKLESAALLSVLDAELSAPNLTVLLNMVLEITAGFFDASVGVVLLKDQDAPSLRIKASFGLKQKLDPDLFVEVGHGFTGTIAATGEANMLPDLETAEGQLNPHLIQHARALWGVPLRTPDEIIGVLVIGFPKPYQWLPTEQDLLRAIAHRSALAIQRARITDTLREREMRIAELSAHLLRAQEQERKRISRELHDETGQALMVIRLYLGMLEASVSARSSKTKIHETLEVVDRTIEGIRRIIGRLSPLVLQELGLIAAIRKEAKDLAKSTGVKARVAVSDSVGRLAPEVETAIYRVVQEALHNVAKHANARTASIHMNRDHGVLRLSIEDDGAGINPVVNPQRPSFGMAGMRERISALGGTMQVTSRRGQGTRIEVSVPVPESTTQEMAGVAENFRSADEQMLGARLGS